MSTTPDLPPLPEKRPISGQAGLNCVIWGKGHDDETLEAYARTHADNCIRALTEDVGKTQEALRSALGEIAELKASCVREPPSVDRGPWSADPENDYVTSADFGWDVSLRVDGDFLSAEERRTYVAWLTDTLNAAS